MSEAITQQRSWLRAIADAAREQAIPIPAFIVQGMGTARTASTGDGRFVTFKRRLVSAAQAAVDGVEWGLWQDQGEYPVLVRSFRESVEPKQANVLAVLAILKGWLVDGWTAEAAQKAGSEKGTSKDSLDGIHYVRFSAPSPPLVFHATLNALDARAIAPSPTNTLLAWETNGVKTASLRSTDVLIAAGVEYRACA